MKTIRIASFCIAFMIASLSIVQAAAKNGKEYSDGHRGKVFFPKGDISFADEVVSFQRGGPGQQETNPDYALGAPNQKKAAVLGCGGVLVLRFTDNALIDVNGPDLYVFEAGPDIEPTNLSLSKDGKDWIGIGKISGGRSDIDISGFVKNGDVFHYVRLQDANAPGCGGNYPGADINAVGAIGSAVQISMKNSVLFDSGKWTLKPEAQQELNSAVLKIEEYPGVRIIIEGHTDSVGSTESNQELSEKRGGAVRDYFLGAKKFTGHAVKIHGYGESRPVATNETEEGRERNRRVEIILMPEKP